MSVDTEAKAIQALCHEMKQLLADALRVADDTETASDRVAKATRVETARVQHVHDDEMSTAQKVHTGEMTAAQERHDEEMATEQRAHYDEMHNLGAALDSRDIFGQAKGIVMVTMHCNADKAFRLIVAQSQAENRKAAEVAAEIVARVARRAEDS